MHRHHSTPRIVEPTPTTRRRAASSQRHTSAAPQGTQTSAQGGHETPQGAEQARHRSGLQILREPIVCYYLFIAVVVVLTLFGLIMVFSSSSVDLVSTGESPYTQLISQSVFAVIGIIVAVIASLLPMKIYERLSFLLLGLALVLQALTLVIGLSSGGNSGWIRLGPVVFQPAEVLKLALCVWLPSVINNGRRRKLGNIKAYIVPLIFFLIGFALVLAGKDLGTGLIVLLIGAVGIFAGGFNLRVYAVAGVLGVLGIVGVFVLGSSNRMSRITALFSGCTDAADAQGVCYQSIHGRYALASGGFTGLGLGASREKWNYLPEAHNDFIFAIIGEEMGFIGAVMIILCFGLIAWCLVTIALKMKNHPYERLVLICITAWIVGQALINIMVVLQLLPVIGLPLPFVSAGGTALVMCLTASGVAVRMAKEQDDIKKIIKRQ